MVRFASVVVLVACAHPATPAPPPIPFTPVAAGPRLVPKQTRLDVAVVPALGTIVRVRLLADQIYVFDAAGHVARGFTPGKLDVLAFSEPVVDLAINGREVDAALASGAVEQIRDGSVWRFELPAKVIGLWGQCMQTSEAAPLECYHPDTPTLSKTSTFGPVTAVELQALKRIDVTLLAEWRRAAGPGALQIDGADGTGFDTRHAGPRATHVCGVLADHTVACWGRSTYAELGDGRRSSDMRYVHVPQLSNIVEVATGDDHTCARDAAGAVWCWGDASRNAFPAVATSSLPSCPIDHAATDAEHARRVDHAHQAAEACSQTTCREGELDCHLGCVFNEPPIELVYDHRTTCVETNGVHNGAGIVLAPTRLVGISDAVSIAAASASTCIVHATGVVQCWTGFPFALEVKHP